MPWRDPTYMHKSHLLAASNSAWSVYTQKLQVHYLLSTGQG
uniref:Uncharacterized protein n=1 Tax=Arundo donax TaxID=35708 RepID=A0A0A9BSN5_ARUDO